MGKKGWNSLAGGNLTTQGGYDDIGSDSGYQQRSSSVGGNGNGNGNGVREEDWNWVEDAKSSSNQQS